MLQKEILIIEGNEKYHSELSEILKEKAPESLSITFIKTKETIRSYLEIDEEGRKRVALIVMDPHTAPGDGSAFFREYSTLYKDQLVIYTANDDFFKDAVTLRVKAASKKCDIADLREAVEIVLYQ